MVCIKTTLNCNKMPKTIPDSDNLSKTRLLCISEPYMYFEKQRKEFGNKMCNKLPTAVIKSQKSSLEVGIYLKTDFWSFPDHVYILKRH